MASDSIANEQLRQFIENFPTGKQLFPFKRYESWEQFWDEMKKPRAQMPNPLAGFQMACTTPAWDAAHDALTEVADAANASGHPEFAREADMIADAF